MAVTEPLANPEALEIERLARSPILQPSESLCKLLRYLAEKALSQPPILVKEYQIATEVFGRPADFDPRVDSTVRVQTGRLRTKLGEYYSHEGKDDPVIVDIPKGAYMLTFAPREGASGAPEVTASVAPEIPSGLATASSKPWRAATIILSVLLAAALASIAALGLRMSKAESSSGEEHLSPALLAFWKTFTDSPEAPWVVFSNAAFVGRPETGMRYFVSGSDRETAILDHYTGVGEVMAIHEIDRVFNLLHHAVHVKRGRLLSLDDLKNNNLIFIGSPSENLTLREFPSTRDFVFRVIPDGPRKGDLGVFDTKPRKGENALYVASPSPTAGEDYAVIAYLPGVNPAHHVLSLGGTTTLGTEAAVEYVCHSGTLEKLTSAILASGGSPDRYFEALLHVNIRGGVPLGSDIVAVHPIR